MKYKTKILNSGQWIFIVDDNSFTQFTELTWLTSSNQRNTSLALTHSLSPVLDKVIEWSRMNESNECRPSPSPYSSIMITFWLDQLDWLTQLDWLWEITRKNGMVLMKKSDEISTAWTLVSSKGYQSIRVYNMQIKGWPFITLYISLRWPLTQI